MLEKCPKNRTFETFPRVKKNKDWLDKPNRSKRFAPEFCDSRSHSFHRWKFDWSSPWRSWWKKFGKHNTVQNSHLECSERLCTPHFVFNWLHLCTWLYCKHPRYISSRLIWARHLAQVAFLELLKTLFNTFEISPSYRSLHSCLSNAFPSLPRHSLPLNFGIVKEKLCNSSSFHISAQELWTSWGCHQGSLHLQQASPRNLLVSLSLWHQTVQHGVRSE